MVRRGLTLISMVLATAAAHPKFRERQLSTIPAVAAEAEKSLANEIVELEASLSEAGDLERGESCEPEGMSAETWKTANPLPAGEAQHMIAYFRHSIKAYGWNDALEGILNEKIDSELMNQCRGTADDALTRCKAWAQNKDGAMPAHLSGNGQASCPHNIGKMLRARFTSPPEQFNLWASPYHRVLGTGLQMFRGVAGKDAEQGVGPAISSDGEATNDQAVLQADILAKLKKEPEQGQCSPWMAEYLRDFSTPEMVNKLQTHPIKNIDQMSLTLTGVAGKFEGFKLKPAGFPMGGSYETMQSCYSTPVYKGAYIGKKGQTIGEPQASIQTLYDTDDADSAKQVDADFDKTTDQQMETILQEMMDGNNMKDDYKFLLSPKEYNKKKYDLDEDPKKTYEYAKLVCRVGQLFLNERAAGLKKDAKPAYMDYIPVCAEAEACGESSDNQDCLKCDKIVQMLDSMCWPVFGKEHNIGKAYGMIDASIAMMLGAMAKRAGYDNNELFSKYDDMLKEAPLGEGQGEERGSLQDGGTSDNKSVLLMSSHDATTNAVRMMMKEAGLTDVKGTEYRSDARHSKMTVKDELSYDVMFTFEMYKDKADGTEWKLQVRNFVATLEQLRLGCKNKGGTELMYDDTSVTWDGTVKDFLTAMAKNLVNKNKDTGARTKLGIQPISKTTLEFLELLSTVH